MGAPSPVPTRTFDFTKVTIVWGNIPITGGVESIKVGRAEDSFTYHVSADGTVTRVVNNNKMGSIVVVFAQNAPILDRLSAQLQLDEATGGQAAPISVRDGNGTSLATAPFAWIKKPPEMEFQKEATMREIAFDCDKLTHTFGGLA